MQKPFLILSRKEGVSKRLNFGGTATRTPRYQTSLKLANSVTISAGNIASFVLRMCRATTNADAANDNRCLSSPTHAHSVNGDEAGGTHLA